MILSLSLVRSDLGCILEVFLVMGWGLGGRDVM